MSSTSTSTSTTSKSKKSSRLFTSIQPTLSDPTRSAIHEFNFTKMTPVQTATIPLFLQNKDVAVQACTGSGKTLCFLIPIVEILYKRKTKLTLHQVGALIITPTRELATQIYQVLSIFLKYFKFSSILLIGGNETSIDAEKFKKEGGNIVVATPGRLEEIIDSLNIFNTKALEMLILDEADRLLDMGFAKSISSILSTLPKQRRTGLFSATSSGEVKSLIRAGMRNPVSIQVTVEDKDGKQSTQKTPTTLTNRFAKIPADEKFAALLTYLKENSHLKIIVFFLTCAIVDYYEKIISKLPEMNGIKVNSIHGKMPQNKRTTVYSEFIAAPTGILLTTDLIARGVDIPDVDIILQYEAPQDPSFYVHRVGRTARAGKQGSALLFLLPNEDNYIEYLQVKQVPVTEIVMPLVTSERASELTETIRALASSDRGILEKGQEAFVSFLRAYKEHQLTFIFRLPQCDLGKVAMGMGLLFFPLTKEIRNIPKSFVPSKVRYNDVKFADKKREKQRIENDKNKSEKIELLKKKRELVKIDKEKIEHAKFQAKKTKNAKRKFNDYAEEWEELQEEARLMKKLTNKQITLEDYELETGEKIDFNGKFAK